MEPVSLLALLALLGAGCSGKDTPASDDTAPTGVDSEDSTPDDTVDTEDTVDTGTTSPDDTSPVDTSTPSTCGDGALTGAELCELDDSVSCGALGALWNSGDAVCRDDCSGFDVSACVLKDVDDRFEFVKPADRDARWADALCADGSGAMATVQIAEDSDVWVLHLSGGGACEDYSRDCTEMGNIPTTEGFTDGSLGPVLAGGLFERSADANPNFADANYVLLATCGADRWTGPTTEPILNTAAPDEGWYFSGRVHLTAIVEVLRQRYGLDINAPETRVLFSGTSGGGLGAMNAMEQIVEMMPALAADGRLKGLADAGWLPRWDDPDYRLLNADVPDIEVYQRQYGFWSASLNSSCVAEQPAGEEGNCYLSEILYPHQPIPVLVQQNAQDPQWFDEHNIDPLNPSDAKVRERWELAMREGMEDVEWLFSGSTPYLPGGGIYHGIATQTPDWDYCPDFPDCAPGTTFGEVLDAFWNDEAPVRIVF